MMTTEKIPHASTWLRQKMMTTEKIPPASAWLRQKMAEYKDIHGDVEIFIDIKKLLIVDEFQNHLTENLKSINEPYPKYTDDVILYLIDFYMCSGEIEQ